MSARSRSSSSRSSSYWRRRVMPSSSASASFQNHRGFGERTKAALDVQIEPVVLSQDMFHLHNGAKQRLARKLVGRLCLTRWRLLSCSSLPRKRPCRLRQVSPLADMPPALFLESDNRPNGLQTPTEVRPSEAGSITEQ